MLYTEIGGKTKIKISKIALGCALMGSQINEKDSFLVIDKFLESGGNIVDTARVYADWLEGGLNVSETTIGKYIKSRKNRGKIIISTKGGHPPLSDMDVSRLDKQSLEADITASLKYLQTDYIDVYFLHRDDKSIPVCEIMPVLNGFVKAGKALLLGCSNWGAARISEANEFALKNKLTPFSISQLMWSFAEVIKPPADKTLVIMNDSEYKWYAQNNFPVMAYSSQANGFFSKAVKDGIENLPQHLKDSYLSGENIRRIKIIEEIIKRTNCSPAFAAISSLLSNPVNTIAVIGPKNFPQLCDSLNGI